MQQATLKVHPASGASFDIPVVVRIAPPSKKTTTATAAIGAKRRWRD